MSSATEPVKDNAHTPLPRVVFVSSGILGYTIGMFVGWSLTPMVGAFLGPLLSVFSVVSLFFASNDSETRLVQIGVKRLAELFTCLALFCIFSIVGCAVGSGIRTERIWPMKQEASTEAKSQLLNVAIAGATATSTDLIRLRVIQELLDDIGTTPEANNEIIKKIGSSLNGASTPSGDLRAKYQTTLRNAKAIVDDHDRFRDRFEKSRLAVEQWKLTEIVKGLSTVADSMTNLESEAEKLRNAIVQLKTTAAEILSAWPMEAGAVPSYLQSHEMKLRVQSDQVVQRAGDLQKTFNFHFRDPIRCRALGRAFYSCYQADVPLSRIDYGPAGKIAKGQIENATQAKELLEKLQLDEIHTRIEELLENVREQSGDSHEYSAIAQRIVSVFEAEIPLRLSTEVTLSDDELDQLLSSDLDTIIKSLKEVGNRPQVLGKRSKREDENPPAAPPLAPAS